jgi:hypothetical protein
MEAAAGVWVCDCCGLPSPLTGPEEAACPGCRRIRQVRFDANGARWFTGMTWIPAERLGPLPHTHCAEHGEEPAAGCCDRCGDFYCLQCARFVEGRSYCTPCFNGLYTEGAFRSLAPALPRWFGAVLALAVLGVLSVFIGLIVFVARTS